MLSGQINTIYMLSNSNNVDRTQTGHILGDVRQRRAMGVSDRAMSPVVFMLIRLLTHLAMLLGATKHPQVSSSHGSGGHKKCSETFVGCCSASSRCQVTRAAPREARPKHEWFWFLDVPACTHVPAFSCSRAQNSVRWDLLGRL